MPGRMVQNSYYLLQEIKNYRKRSVAIEVNKTYSTKYQMKIMNYFCTVLLLFSFMKMNKLQYFL